VFRLSDHVSPALGGLIAYFIFYWWHRWRHESDLLWRLFHQIHHSPQRLEVITSFYKHPCGFDDDREQRLTDMLVYRDVYRS
jgi:hypothetical protein